MKKTFIVKSSFAALIFFLSSHAFGSDLTNPGFESEALGDEWVVRGSGYEVDIDRSEYNEGQASLRVAAMTGARGILFQQVIDADELRRSPMILRAAIKTQDVAVSATAFVTVKSSTGEDLFSYDMRDRVVKGDTSFAYHQIMIPRLESAGSITIGGVVIGSGTAWFDDFSLQVESSFDGPMSQAASDYLDEALDLIYERALGADQVDWSVAREGIFSSVAGAQYPHQTYPAIRAAISMLPNSSHMSLVEGKASNDPLTESSEADLSKTSRLSVPEATVLEGIGFLRLPMFQGGTDDKSASQYVSNALNVLRFSKLSATCGWIIDLRGNSGGNMWVMLASVSPFLSDGLVGRTMDTEGNSAPWLIDGNNVLTRRASGESVIRVQGANRASAEVVKVKGPIAVLIDGQTASAAENIAIALRGEEFAYLVGSPTRGLTTTNIPFPLSDGAQLVLSVGFAATRDSIPVSGAVEPDIALEGEGALEYARQQLHSQCEVAE